MAIPIPNLDERRYQELVDEARARVPVHTPEWTNLQPSDPGVAIIELFAFFAETILYRCNQVPERNRRVFLNLLELPLRPATPAQGLVTLSNERGPLRTITLNADLEVRAGAVPFRTTAGLDVLPIEARAYIKRLPAAPTDGQMNYYNQLYATFLTGAPTAALTLYETVPLDERLAGGAAFSDTIDGAIWVALLARAADADIDDVRRKIVGKSLSLGVVPVAGETGLRLTPGGKLGTTAPAPLVEIPKLPPGGVLPADDALRVATYQAVPARTDGDVLTNPGVLEIDLPGDPTALGLWADLGPLEHGSRNFPPALDDPSLAPRVLTWLRISAASGRVLWLGANAVGITQRAHVAGERLPDGTGEPDQAAALANRPILPGSVRLTVTANGQVTTWQEIDSLDAAGPEVPTPDPLRPPGQTTAPNPRVNVFAVDAEAGTIRFGDGTRGRRPPLGARIVVDYDTCVGPAGNVVAGAINGGPALPAGLKATNPVRTWGGTAAETAAEGEHQIAAQVQHQDRTVTAADFATIALRTPGADVGRVVVLPAYHPDLSPSEPGDAPGAVTLMLVPRFDPDQPDAPSPDRAFFDAVCNYIDPRRLVTTEVFLRGPTYVPIWISVGLETRAGVGFAAVREAVRAALLAYLSPLPGVDAAIDARGSVFDNVTAAPPDQGGWPLRKPINALELAAVAARLPDVLLVRNLLLAEADSPAASLIPLNGLELPRVVGLSIAAGDPLDLDALRGRGPVAPPAQTVPVPIVPEECI